MKDSFIMFLCFLFGFPIGYVVARLENILKRRFPNRTTLIVLVPILGLSTVAAGFVLLLINWIQTIL